MDTNIYNGYGNPFFQHGGQGYHNGFFKVDIQVEDAVLKALIPTLDTLNLNELAALTTYISSYGNEMFQEYLIGRENEGVPLSRSSWDLNKAAHKAYLLAKEAANKAIKNHLDGLNYFEALALTAYVNAHFVGMFANYVLMRQMHDQALKYNRLDSASSFAGRLASQRRKLGLPPASEGSK